MGSPHTHRPKSHVVFNGARTQRARRGPEGSRRSHSQLPTHPSPTHPMQTKLREPVAIYDTVSTLRMVFPPGGNRFLGVRTFLQDAVITVFIRHIALKTRYHSARSTPVATSRRQRTPCSAILAPPSLPRRSSRSSPLAPPPLPSPWRSSYLLTLEHASSTTTTCRTKPATFPIGVHSARGAHKATQLSLSASYSKPSSHTQIVGTPLGVEFDGHNVVQSDADTQ